MQRVTASQSAFSNVIGEPGHTEHRPRELRYGVSFECLVRICALLNTGTAGLRAYRIISNLIRLFLQTVRNLDPKMVESYQPMWLPLPEVLALARAG